MIIKSHRVVLSGTDGSHKFDEKRAAVEKKVNEIISNAKEDANLLIEEAEKKSENLLQDAKNRAEDIIKSSEEESERLKKESSETGFNEGYSKGYDEGHNNGYKDAKDVGEKETNDLLEDINAVKSDIFRSKERMAVELEEEIVKMVYTIFEKIVRKLTEEDKNLILSMVKNGIKDLNTDGKLTIITGRKDYEYLKLHEDEINEKVNFSEGVELKYDNDMKSGDCIIETPKGNIDLSLVSQLQELKLFLKEILDSEA